MMLCEVCSAIDFRPLHQCKGSTNGTEDKSDAAYQWAYISEEACEWWQRGEGPLQVYYFHHERASDLMRSARSGCHLCATIAFGLFRPEVALTSDSLDLPDPPQSNKSIVMMLYLQQGCMSWRDVPTYEFIRVFCGQLSCQLESMEAYLSQTGSSAVSLNDRYAQHCHELEQAWQERQMTGVLSTWTDTNVRLAQAWYENCRQNHARCCDAQPYLPYRVIDIGNQDLWLIEPPPQTRADYTTLSYCWGSGAERAAHLTSQVHQEGLLAPLAQWPTLFQDVIAVTRAFGIRYLWIDAICIQQSSSIDWEIESAKMGQYYRNSTFTIAALKANSSNESLFGYRNPLLTYPHHLILAPHEAGDAVFERYYCVANYNNFSPYDKEDDSRQSPLQSRGWVLQEEILSTRALRFGRHRISWHCLGGRYSESTIAETDESDMSTLRYPMQLVLDKLDPGWVGSRSGHHDAWYEILGRMNRRNITYKKDLLPAISGLASTLATFFSPPDQYLAGVWKQDLRVGLLWHRGPDTTHRAIVPQRQANYRMDDFYAPSWSWTSLAHKSLNFKLHPKLLPPYGALLREYPKTELASSHIELQNDDVPFGRIKFGSLTFSVQCPQISIFLETKPIVDVTMSIQVLESRGIGSEAAPYLRLDMSRAGFEIPAWYSEDLEDKPFTGDCILDRDQDDFAPHERSAIRDYVEAESSTGGVWSRLQSLMLGRRYRVMRGVFLPLLTYDPEITSVRGVSNQRTIGLALVPVPGPNDPNHSESPPHYYKRVGRASVNIKQMYWMSPCKLPERRITII